MILSFILIMQVMKQKLEVMRFDSVTAVNIKIYRPARAFCWLFIPAFWWLISNPLPHCTVSYHKAIALKDGSVCSVHVV